MQSNEDFFSVSEHFSLILATLAPEERQVYDAMRNTRTETGFLGRRFIVYRNSKAGPKVLEELTIAAFAVDPKGTRMTIAGDNREMLVDYAPHRLFDYPAFIWLPLHNKLRYSMNSETKSLAFDVTLRTQSRRHLRELGVVYVETSTSYAKEIMIGTAA